MYEEESVARAEKPAISAKDILEDIRAGCSDSELMRKYNLSARGLHRVFKKLVRAKVVTDTEISERDLPHAVAAVATRALQRIQSLSTGCAKQSASIPRWLSLYMMQSVHLIGAFLEMSASAAWAPGGSRLVSERKECWS